MPFVPVFDMPSPWATCRDHDVISHRRCLSDGRDTTPKHDPDDHLYNKWIHLYGASGSCLDVVSLHSSRLLSPPVALPNEVMRFSCRSTPLPTPHHRRRRPVASTTTAAGQRSAAAVPWSERRTPSRLSRSRWTTRARHGRNAAELRSSSEARSTA